MGKRVKFSSTSRLVNELSEANAEGRIAAMLKDLARNDMIILDEWGYLPTDPDGARLLFRVVSMCYERISLVLTTNIEFSKWGVVFGDDKLASALIDRIMHHGRLVEFNGTSKRMEHALMLGKAADAAARTRRPASLRIASKPGRRICRQELDETHTCA